MAFTNTKNAAVVGLDMAFAAILKTDPLNTGATTETTPIYEHLNPLPNVRSASVSSADSTTIEYFDNAAKYSILSKGNKTVTLSRSHFSNEELKMYFGLQTSEDWITLEGSESIPPYVALGFRRLKIGQDGGQYYDYVWYLKGILRINDDAAETRQESPALQLRTAVGEFIERQADGFTVIKVSTDDLNINQTVFNNWFTLQTLNKLYKAATLGNGGSEFNGYGDDDD